MTTGVRVAYPVALLGLAVAGFFLDVGWWVGALIGLAVMAPIVAIDLVLTRRRTADFSDAER
jgi:asparagine N-glycosylation enzyme membrane subunit Stt3